MDGYSKEVQQIFWLATRRMLSWYVSKIVHFIRPLKFQFLQGGCLMELFIQLAIIMIGKQVFNTFLEMGWPYVIKKYNKFKLKTPQRTVEHEDIKVYNQWSKDYKLLPWSTMGLFHEYLEMILQFG
jgi:Calcium-activated chloride channel